MSYDPHMEELWQTPRWWDAQFRKLLDENRPPYDPAEHEGHQRETICTLASTREREYCVDCGWGN